MATKCEAYQQNIKNFETAITSTTADFNNKKATAQAWLTSFGADFGSSCGRNVVYDPNVNSYLPSGRVSHAGCQTIAFKCKKESCEGRINNEINGSLAAMQSAYVSMNNAISNLATEKDRFNNDPDCKEQQQAQTGQQVRDSEKNRQLRNNIIIVVVVLLIIGVGIWAWRKFRKKS